MEVPSADDDGVFPDTPGPDMLAPSNQNLVVDLLANRSDPPIPSDASDRRSSRLIGSTSPPPGMLEGDHDLAERSDSGQGWPIPEKESDKIIVDSDENDAPPRLDKGKAPEIVCLQGASDGGSGTPSLVPPSGWVRGDAQDLSGLRSMEGEPLGICDDRMEGDENSARATASESQDTSYSSGLFDEAQDHNPDATTSPLVGQLTLSKQKQKAYPEDGTGPLAEANEEESRFQPLNPGDPGWERSAGRPPRKLPIRFHDAIGRNYLFPWEKAKTWVGMKRLIDSCFPDHDILATHVELCRYDLSVTLPVPANTANNTASSIASSSTIPAQGSTSTAETAGSSSTSSASSSHQQQESWFIILPELWEDTIEPGMLVEQKMWPFQPPNYIIHPAPLPPPQPQPPHHHHHHHHPIPPARGRGAHGRGRGGGAGLFGGGRGGGIGGSSNNSFAPLPPPPGVPRPPIVAIQVGPLHRGKTRKR